MILQRLKHASPDQRMKTASDRSVDAASVRPPRPQIDGSMALKSCGVGASYLTLWTY